MLAFCVQFAGEWNQKISFATTALSNTFARSLLGRIHWSPSCPLQLSVLQLSLQSVGCVMSPRDAADLEWPLSEGMQVSALPPVWIAMIISCWNVKLLKLSSVTLTHICGTNSHNRRAKGQPRVGVVKIFCDSDSSGWKSFRLHSLGCNPRWYCSDNVCGTFKLKTDFWR